MFEFEFANELNDTLERLNLSYNDIQAVEVGIYKKIYITDEQKIYKDIVFEVPAKHTYEDIVKVINAIDKEARTPVIDYEDTEREETHFDFIIGGVIWLNNGDRFEIEDDWDTYYYFFRHHPLVTIGEELLNGTTCTFGEITIRYNEEEYDEY